MLLQIKDKKHVEQNYHFVAWVMLKAWDFGCWDDRNSVGICNGTPSAVFSSFISFSHFCTKTCYHMGVRVLSVGIKRTLIETFEPFFFSTNWCTK